MMTPVMYPTGELVAQAWIASIPGWSAGVGQQLPADDSTWTETGFVTVSVVGGSPDVDIPIKKPVVQVDCWATMPGSNKPPWRMAANLAEQIRVACYDRLMFGRELRPRVDEIVYLTARATTAYMVTEPRPLYDDAADYAHYQFDLSLWWVTLDR